MHVAVPSIEGWAYSIKVLLGFSNPAVPLPAPAIFAAPRIGVSSIFGLSLLDETLASNKLRNLQKVLPISRSNGSKVEVLLLIINWSSKIIKREKKLNNKQGSNNQD